MPPKTKVRKNLDTTHNSATYVVLLKENHMQLTEAASLGRKSGGAEDLQFRYTSSQCVGCPANSAYC
jgi:hypothetical protein